MTMASGVNENPRRSTRIRRPSEKVILSSGEDDNARQEPVQGPSTSTAVFGGDSESNIEENQCPKCLFKFTRPENLTRHLTQRKKWCQRRVEENRKKKGETQEQEETQQEETEITMATENPRRSTRTRRESEKLILSRGDNVKETLEGPSSSISIAAASGGDPRRNLNGKQATFEKNQCPKCLYIFSNAKSLRRHRRIALEWCRRRMEENRKMKGGTQEVIKITSKKAAGSSSHGNALTCRECSQPFGTRQKLRIHLKEEHKRKLFHCKRCTWWSTRLNRLEEHCVKAHGITLKPGGDEGFKCRCMNCYESEGGLSKHLEQSGHKKMGEVTKRRLEEEPVQGSKYFRKCCQCSRIFENRKEHKVHMEVNHGRQCFQCQKCDKWYLKKDGLKEHQGKVHAGMEGIRKKKEVTTRLGRKIKPRRELSPSEEMEVDQEGEWEDVEGETNEEEEIGGDDGACGGDDDEEEWLDDPKDFAEMRLLEKMPEEGFMKLEKLQGMASRNKAEQKKKWDPNWFLHMGRFKKEDSIWEQGKE